MRGRLYRSRRNRMLAGVCGGLGEYVGVDPTWIRLAWAGLSILTFHFGVGILLYVLWWLVVPEGDGPA
ncbi:MAG: PspC domain-containing protein [Firmicutes bacterium]|nr:PspC domain-containing protein [Bacillota bacterium]